MSEAGAFTVIVVDDESPARGLVREFLAGHADMRLVAECANGFEAVKAANAHNPDLIILDVQMPKLDGFEVLELLGPETRAVIFTTAFDSYALRAFNVHAVDYLLKPFSAERFSEALALARTRLVKSEPVPARELFETRRDGAPLDRLLIRDRSNVHVISVDQVDFVESQDDYISIRAAGKNYLKEQAISDLERQLPPQGFVRIHRRFLLNIARLAKIELSEKENRVAILLDKTQLPISRSGYAKLRAVLDG
ncbi:MAG TPA: response regulator [Steroidobacteraceae bacterium]|jgi:two-component system LytT family response regulator